MVINETKRGKSVFYSAPDGLKLHAVDYGVRNDETLPVICLAGLSRNARDFARLAVHLAEDASPQRRVICFDYRGRGLSDHDSDWTHYNILTEAEDVIAGLEKFGIEQATLIGTSRGGLIAMAIAAMRPGLLRAVILNDVGPVIGTESLLAIRTMLSDPPEPKDWAEAIAIQKSLMGAAFPALTEEDWIYEAHAKFRQIGDTLVADHDPALGKTLDALVPGEELPALWPQFEALRDIPVMVLRGENSGLLSQETVDEMAARHPRLQCIDVEGQGHAPLLHTAGLPQMIQRFLDQAGT